MAGRGLTNEEYDRVIQFGYDLFKDFKGHKPTHKEIGKYMWTWMKERGHMPNRSIPITQWLGGGFVSKKGLTELWLTQSYIAMTKPAIDLIGDGKVQFRVVEVDGRRCLLIRTSDTEGYKPTHRKGHIATLGSNALSNVLVEAGIILNKRYVVSKQEGGFIAVPKGAVNESNREGQTTETSKAS